MRSTKVVQTRVTNEQLEEARGGYDPAAGTYRPYRLWVSCPSNYDAAAITAEDILHDGAIAVVDRPPAGLEEDVNGH